MLRREEVLKRFSSLRRAVLAGGQRAPHKPLLALYLLGRLQQSSDSGAIRVSYPTVDAAVSPLIAEFGPVSKDKHRAALPFFHLDASVWRIERDGLEPRHSRLRDKEAVGELDPEVAQTLRSDPTLLAEVARMLLESNFPETYWAPICASVGLEVSVSTSATTSEQKRRSTEFRERVLRTYNEACAFCGFSGMARQGSNVLTPVGLAAAHVQWFSSDGPDEVNNGLALCDLHHTLFDRGLLGVNDQRIVVVSECYAAKDARSRALVADLKLSEPPREAVLAQYFEWHRREVFRSIAA